MELEHRIMPLIFVLSGAANVLLIKFSDTSLGECRDGQWRHFQHPLVQTALMFMGELLCYLVYKTVFWFLQRREDGSESTNLITRGGREFSVFSFVLPAFLDAITSILLFTGLYLTYASSFQMIRGTAIIFVGIFSSIYLSQILITRHWMAMFTIACGIVVILSVDVQRVLYDRESLAHGDANSILTGDLLIICAQVFHAAQLVYHEKHLKQEDIPPMQAIGLQGMFGLLITLLLAVTMNFMPSSLPFIDNSRGVVDDLGDVFIQLHSNTWLCIALVAFVFTSALYNLSTLSIVKFSSSSNLILADGLSVLVIWLFAILYGWELLNLVTFLGFIILQMGAIAYRNAIFLEWYRSLLARIMRRRYADLSVDGENSGINTSSPTSRPADVI